MAQDGKGYSITDFGGKVRAFGDELHYSYVAGESSLCIEDLSASNAGQILEAIARHLADAASTTADPTARVSHAEPQYKGPRPRARRAAPSVSVTPTEPGTVRVSVPVNEPSSEPEEPADDEDVEDEDGEGEDEEPTNGQAAVESKGTVGYDLEILKTASTLRAVLEHLFEHGATDADALVETCVSLKDQVPVLGRVANLPERIKRALAVMGHGAE